MEFDLLSFRKNEATLIFEGNALSAVKNVSSERHGFRRFENGKQFQTSRVGTANQESLLAESKRWGGDGVAHEFGFAEAAKLSRERPRIADEKNQEFRATLERLISRFPGFVFSGRSAQAWNQVELRSSYGLDLRTAGSSFDWYVTFQRKGSGNLFDGYFAATSEAPDFAADFNAQEEFLEAQKRTVALRSGKMPMVFPEPFPILQKLTESFSAQKYWDGSCHFAGKLGADLFSPQITLLDQAYDPSSGQFQFFDGEGTVRAQDSLALIEKGRFANLIYDRRFGHKHGQSSTGNGVRAFNSGVGLSLRAPQFQKGQKPWRELIRDLDQCLLVSMSSGGDSNELGGFSAPVQLAYVFERGELKGMAPQFSFKTKVDDFLGKSLIGVASDGYMKGASSPCLVAEVDLLIP